MTADELEKLVDQILLKQTEGEALSQKEQEILAYSFYAAGCSSCREKH
jgi:hypothetical protein